jgi:serpin B
MVIPLPEPEKLSSFKEDLQAARLEIFLQALDFRSVAVSLPQFEFDSSLELASVLAKMSMPHAFSDQADFSGMDDGDTLKISDVIHKRGFCITPNQVQSRIQE